MKAIALGNKKTGAVVLTEGTVWKKMLLFALPIFIGTLFQQLYHTADTMIVGSSLGKQALAAVGSTGSLMFLFIGFFNGLGVGAGVVVARFFGAKRMTDLRKAIHTTVAVGLIGGALLTILGVTLAPVLLKLTRTPDDVIELASTYLRIIFCGAIGLVTYNILAGILQAVGDSRHPLYYLIISSILNVILDYLFIVVMGFGVGAAALATIISQYASVAMSGYRLMKKSPEEYTLHLKEIRPDRGMLGLILKNGVPSGLQMCFNSLANVIVQANINVFGSTVVAGCAAFSSLEGFAFLPINSIASTMATFVSQNIGAQEFGRVKQGARFGLIAAPLVSAAIGLIMGVFMPQLVSIFADDAAVIAAGTLRGRLNFPFFILPAFTHIVAGIMRGAGKAYIPMFVILGSWGIIRVLYIIIVTSLIRSEIAVYWAFPITWVISSLSMAAMLLKVDWVHGTGMKAKTS